MGNKIGRPKTKDVKNTCKNINVAVPITLLKRWEEIKIVHGSNLTGYITKLIEKDMDANYEQYYNLINAVKDLENNERIDFTEFVPEGVDIHEMTKDELSKIYKEIIKFINF